MMVILAVCALAAFAKLWGSAAYKSWYLFQDLAGLKWCMYFAGFATLAIAGASVGAIVGRKLNRATTVLLAAIGGVAATAVYHPILGVLIGVLIGGLVAIGVARLVAIAMAKTLVAMLIGTVGGTVALSTYHDSAELPIVASTIMATCFALVVVGIILSVVMRESDNARQMLSRLAVRSLLIIPLLFGSWLAISVDVLWRIHSLSGNLPEVVPMNGDWLWRGMLDVSQLRIRSNVTNDDLKTLRRLTNLTNLSLWHSDGVTDDGLRNIRELSGMAHLSIGETPIADAGLVNLHGMTGLQYLHLRATRVTGTGLSHLSSSRLIALYLNESPIADDGLRNIGHLVGLRQIDLRKTEVTDEGMGYLTALPSLTYVGLNGTRVTDAGLEKLSRISTLTGLDLGGTAITDEGLQYFTRLPALMGLDLSDTQISDDGVRRLESLTTLSYLNLVGTNVTVAGIKDLKAARPNLRVDPPTATATQTE